jgi:hypothetical protein
MDYLLILIIILIIIIILYLLKPTFDKFTVPSIEIQPCCIYVCYKIDELDYKFISNHNNIIKFYVVNSIDENNQPNEYSNKIKELNNVIYIERQNNGWDTTAWKETILNHYDELSQYDLIILANNSNSYNFNLINFCSHAIDYDMYGLKDAEDYQHHFQSYFISIHKQLFIDQEFKKYWETMPPITKRDEAIAFHELRFKQYFAKRGYKQGVYDITKIVPYFEASTHGNRKYYPETIKKVALSDLYYKNLKKNIKYHD